MSAMLSKVLWDAGLEPGTFEYAPYLPNDLTN